MTTKPESGEGAARGSLTSIVLSQYGELDGQVIHIGDGATSISIHLQDGSTIHSELHATPEIARRLARRHRDGAVRVYGSGEWLRAETGEWRLLSFRIVDFEVLDETPLPDLVAALRRTSGSEWGEVADPLAEILSNRHGAAR